MAQTYNLVDPGTVIAGRYEIESELGRGGMGMVFAAKHLGLRQRVALKLMARPLDSDAVSDLARFEREARAVARLRSAHVVRMLDFGQTEAGQAFIVMELLEGCDFEELFRRRAPMPLAELVDLVLQACEALAEAHALGVVHRDLKPANLFLTTGPDGSPLVKVLDFGISKVEPTLLETSGAWARTAAATPMGSPLYMSPEQFRSARDVDARTDIWSLGVILWEGATRTHPFEAERREELFAKILTDAPRDIDKLLPQAPAFAAVLRRCLDKDPEERFADVAALACALTPFASSEESLGRIERVLGIAAGRKGGGLAPTLKAPLAPSPTAPRRRRRSWFVGALIVAAAASASLALARHWAPAPPDPVITEAPPDRAESPTPRPRASAPVAGATTASVSPAPAPAPAPPAVQAPSPAPPPPAPPRPPAAVTAPRRGPRLGPPGAARSEASPSATPPDLYRDRM